MTSFAIGHAVAHVAHDYARSMRKRRFGTPAPLVRSVVFFLIMAALDCGFRGASAQAYPNRPFRFVTAEPGGGSDLAARLIGQGVSANTAQPVIVDNRPAGVIPAEIVSKASPDGYTILVTGSTFWVGPLLQAAPYDPIKNFSPITLAASSPNVIAITPSVPAKSIAELIALAKARPGELNYASGPAGSTNHLAAELFKLMAGINLVRVPYKSTGQAVSDLVAGRVQVMFVSLAGAMPQVKAGKLRALALTSAAPTELFPGLPTAASTGLPGYQSVNTTSVFAPSQTPAAVIGRLNREILQVLGRAEVKEKFFAAGADVVGSSPQELDALMKAEIGAMGKLIKASGIRAE